MAQSVINIGAQANDGSGDTIRNAGLKINTNFTELYAQAIHAGDIKFRGNNITTEGKDFLKDLNESWLELSNAVTKIRNK